MEFISAFILGTLASYYTLAALLLVALWVEHGLWHRSAAFLTVLATASAYVIFAIPLYIFIPAYLVAGLVWSVWRWGIHCRKCTELAKEGKLQSGSWFESGGLNKDQSRIALESAVSLKDNLDKLVSWVLGWPISMVDRAVHDTIHILKIAITEYFAKIYTSFSNKALKDFDNDV